jgi:hypothetical protein
MRIFPAHPTDSVVDRRKVKVANVDDFVKHSDSMDNAVAQARG